MEGRAAAAAIAGLTGNAPSIASDSMNDAIFMVSLSSFAVHAAPSASRTAQREPVMISSRWPASIAGRK